MVDIGTSYTLTGKLKEFQMPPVSDGLVIGRDAPIDYSAISRALELLVASQFQAIPVDDDVVGHIIIRRNLLRRISEERVLGFILSRVKPLMGPEEIMHLDLSVEVKIEDTDS